MPNAARCGWVAILASSCDQGRRVRCTTRMRYAIRYGANEMRYDADTKYDRVRAGHRPPPGKGRKGGGGCSKKKAHRVETTNAAPKKTTPPFPGCSPPAPTPCTARAPRSWSPPGEVPPPRKVCALAPALVSLRPPLGTGAFEARKKSDRGKGEERRARGKREQGKGEGRTEKREHRREKREEGREKRE